MKNARALAAAVLLSCAAEAHAQNDLPQERICKEAFIDKGQFAEYLIETFPVNMVAMPDTGGAVSRTEMFKRVLADYDVCVNNKRCSNADKSNLDTARGTVRGLLSGRDEKFEATTNVSVTTYFATENQAYRIKCLKGAATPKPPAFFDTPPSKSKSELRLRGKVDDIFVKRQSKDAFKAASQATINFQTDAEANKRTATFQGVVGYAIETDLLKKPGEAFDLIPYAYVNTSAVRSGSGKSVKDTSAEVYSFGVTASARWYTNPMGHILNFRPDYLMNTDDDSRILSFNAQYIPVLGGVLNSFVTVGQDFISFKPTLDFRWNNGWYLDEGIPVADPPKGDFSRVGGLAGIAIVSDNKNIPLSFVSTYTLLDDLKDGPNIRYFANTLTLSLDPDKYFGISGSYLTGRREDTAKEEQVWKIGLTGKF
mgnify:CR=1 FL=1